MDLQNCLKSLRVCEDFFRKRNFCYVKLKMSISKVAVSFETWS